MTVARHGHLFHRIRLTGPRAEVMAAYERYKARGFRAGDWNPLRSAGGQIDGSRLGITMERRVDPEAWPLSHLAVLREIAES